MEMESGLWGMTTSVIQRKGLSKDYCVHRKGDSLVSQKWDKPRVIPPLWMEMESTLRIMAFEGYHGWVILLTPDLFKPLLNQTLIKPLVGINP